MKQWIAGSSLVGFYGLFENDFGRPETETDMPTMIPSWVGNSLLPFRCPHCSGVPQALACPLTREKYKDTRPGRTNYFCPLCGGRFRIDLRGCPLPSPLEAGATVGPSQIQRGESITWQDRPSLVQKIVGTLLGWMYAPVDYSHLGRLR